MSRGSPHAGIVVAVSMAALLMFGCGREGSLASRESFCPVEQELDEAFDRHFSGLTESSTMEQQATAAVAAAKEVVESGLVELAVRLTPNEIRADIATLEAATRKAAAGDPSAIFGMDVQAADERVHKYCGFPEEEGE